MKGVKHLKQNGASIGLIIQVDVMDEQINEDACLQRAKKGDLQAFGELVKYHQLFLYNLALRSVSHPQEAEDVTQETFLRAWRYLPSFRGDSLFRTWLYRILVNICYDRYPRLKRDFEMLALDDVDITEQESGSLESTLEQWELSQLIQQMMENLSENYRMVLFLRYSQELSYQEISTVLNLPSGTVKTIIHRARRQLKLLLSKHLEVFEWVN